ncbi:MAG TPA: phosphopantetheine-binding protein [Chryseolinea sp.]|nr:phosphopantetheine-binding protein [Chryseolinea sp.]HPM31079.1 phosphopantetheine-binding protein [Chryseolinea sp.]
MQTKEELVTELKALIIKQLNLEEVAPESFDENTPLFGEGLGLDSIDALELVVLLDKNYGIKIQDPKAARKVFENVRTMVEYIQENKK